MAQAAHGETRELPVSALPKVSLVIPTWNEALNLPHVAPRLPSWVYEVVIVDGPSTDGTVDVAKNRLPGWPRQGQCLALRI